MNKTELTVVFLINTLLDDYQELMFAQRLEYNKAMRTPGVEYQVGSFPLSMLRKQALDVIPDPVQRAHYTHMLVGLKQLQTQENGMREQLIDLFGVLDVDANPYDGLGSEFWQFQNFLYSEVWSNKE